MRHGLFRSIVGLALAAPLLLPGASAVSAQSEATPIVEPARQVTTDPRPDRLYDSPAVAVDPTNPETVVIATGDARNGGCGLHVSRDAGVTFAPAAKTFMPPELPYCFQLNFGPAIDLAFAPSGELYIATAGSSLQTGHPRGPVDALTIRSSDLGLTSEASTVEKATPIPYTAAGQNEMGTSSLGNNTIAVDTKNPQRIYRSFRYRTRGPSAPDRPRVTVSNDGGRTWAKSIDPFDELGADVYGGDLPMLAAGPGGVVYGLTRERLKPAAAGQPRATKQRVFMSKSTDGGQSWKTTVAFDNAKSLSDPGVAVDPRTGNLYAVFENEVENGLVHVFFMASSDQGKTWSRPVSIIDDPGKGYNQSVPGISIAPDGRVDVAWYDFRNDPFFTSDGTVKQRYVDVYSASSNDNGRSWSKNLRVSDRTIDTSIGVTFNNQDIRAPMGIASTKDAALIAWSDSRAGALPQFDVEDAYFTRVRFHTAAAVASESGFDASSAVAGAGAALAVAGLVLLLANRLRRRPSEE